MERSRLFCDSLDNDGRADTGRMIAPLPFERATGGSGCGACADFRITSDEGSRTLNVIASSLDHRGTLLSWRTNGGLIGAVVLSGIVIGYVSRDFDVCCR
jgi:hypothetical protein